MRYIIPSLVPDHDGARGGRTLSYFRPRSWSGSDDVTDEVALHPDHLVRAPIDALSTLVHEICH